MVAFARGNRLLAQLLGIILLAACAGRGPEAGLPAASAGSPRQAQFTAMLRIHIPNHVRHHRRDRYVSPATQSAAISISPGAGCAACSHAVTLDAALTPGSPNCSANAAGTACSFALALAPGSYAGSMATYDGALTGGKPSGNELSANDAFPVAIAAGAANAIGVTLDGIPHGAAFGIVSAPIGSSMTNDPFTGWNLAFMPAGRTGQIAVFAVDKDGYVIAGAGSPSVSAAMSGPVGFSATVTPGTNVVRIATPPHVTVGSSFDDDTLNVTFTGAGCTEAGAICDGSLKVGMREMIVTTDQTDGYVNVDTEDGLRIAQITSVANPSSAALDTQGNLFVVDSSTTGTVKEFAWPYTGTPVQFGFNVIDSFNRAIAIDPRNDDVALLSASKLELYTPPYTGSPTTHTLSSSPLAEAFDSGGNLYVTSADGYLRKYPAPLFSSPYTVNVGDTGLWYLFIDNDFGGPSFTQVYAGGRTSGKGYRFDTSLNEVGLPDTMPSTIDGITEANAQVYISEASGNVVSNFGFYNYTVGMNAPSSLAFDIRNNALVVLQSGSGVVSFYDANSNFFKSQFELYVAQATAMTLWP